MPDGDTRPRVALFGLPPVYAEGLAALLGTNGMRCTVLSQLGAVPELLSAGPLVLVLPGPRGGEVPRQPGAATGRLDVVHVVDRMSVESCAAALRSGAVGVVDVTSELEAIATAVRSAATGHTALPGDVARALARAGRAVDAELDQRDREWLRLLADGTTVSALARRTGYSERETYRLLSALYARLGCTSRIQALLIAERAGLLDEDTTGSA